ncbi:hypothetical protein Tco_0039642 [Tanacetum coccineum]
MKLYVNFYGKRDTTAWEGRTTYSVVMSSASFAVTYTSIYTDSEPGRAFWGADDEEISEGGLEDPQTPPVPQDEDEREPMFVHAHDPDYMSEPIYPEYIPLEDEHEFSAEEQPLPPCLNYLTAESPDKCPVELSYGRGDDGDDNDGDSSRDDANDEDNDEDEDEEEGDEEEEHLDLADSAVVVPTDELVSPPEGQSLLY